MKSIFRKSIDKFASKAGDRELVNEVHNRSPRILDNYSAIQRGVHAVWWLEAEINNGGAEQYFTNSTADDYPLLCEFLTLVDAKNTAQALIAFGRLFGEPDASFPERKARIDIVKEKEESGENDWGLIAVAATNEISDTFDEMHERVAVHIRNNLQKING